MSETPLKIMIAGMEYSLRVKEADRENVLEASRLINEKVAEFEKQYNVKEKRDVLAMVFLQTVSQFLQNDNKHSQEANRLRTMLDDLNQMVKDHQSRVH
jgi:cell division protein ZapA